MISFPSCKKETIMLPPDLGEKYFPIKQGSWISYKVDSIVWNNFYTPVKIDTFSFYLKMKIDSQYTDNEGRTIYYYRKYYSLTNSNWQLSKNYSINKTAQRIETFEENYTYIKMVFPVKNSTIWDMNAFNIFDKTESYFQNYDVSKTYNGEFFDSCAVVNHQNLETLISKNYHEEVYGKNIGLLYKKLIKIEKAINGTWNNGVSCTYSIVGRGQD